MFFYLMLGLLAIELMLLLKASRLTLESVRAWSFGVLFYVLSILVIVYALLVYNRSSREQVIYNDLQIQTAVGILFMMRSVRFKHFLATYCLFFVGRIAAVIVLASSISVFLVEILSGQVLYATMLALGVHHRETIQRKQLNYERVLDMEIEKTHELISKLVPLHMVTVIQNEKRQVDEFKDMTMLFTDMVGFTAFSNNKDPREVVSLLSKLFSRFDQLCDEFRVYKVHTIGDCYVIMGYTGRLDKAKRTP